MQDINLKQIKLKVKDTYKKDEKITTNFEPSNDEDIINKAIDIEILKVEGRISYQKKRLH